MKSTNDLRHLRRRIDGDDIVTRPATWGTSAIYFETSQEGFVIRQIQLFESGVVLVYDEAHHHDDYGWLWGTEVFARPPITVQITSKEFQQVWMRHIDAKNR